MLKEELYDGLVYELPPMPPKKDILFSDLPKKQQKWRRQELPDNFDGLTQKEKKAFIDKEWDRRLNGLWFMNNGVPTYITGSHYMYINWTRYGDGYRDYRDVSRRRYYMRDLVMRDRRCMGLLEVKGRRQGVTSELESMGVDVVTKTEDAHCGIVSKSGQDAKDAFEECTEILNDYPSFFMPSGIKPTNQSLNFSGDVKEELLGSSTGKRKVLKSKLSWRATTKKAYDSKKLRWALFDEGGKFDKKCNFAEFIRVNKTCFTKGATIYGKGFMPTTIDEDIGDNMDGYKKIFEDSNPKERNANGMTKTGFYRMFLPAYDGYEGYIDEYGMSVIDTPTKEQTEYMLNSPEPPPNPYIGSKQYLENEREPLKGLALMQHRRQYPFTVEEAFRIETKNCIFDPQKISERFEIVNSPLWKGYTRGDLMWTNGEDSDVEFVHKSNGRFLMSKIGIPDEFKNGVHRNGSGDSFRCTPKNSTVYVIGVDPYKVSQTADGKGSKAAAYLFRCHDPMIDHDPKPVHEWETNRFIIEYIARPPAINDMYEDLIKLCVYSGGMLNYENNVAGIEYHFQQRGYFGFLMSKPEIARGLNQQRNVNQVGTTTNEATTETGAGLIDDYISRDIYGSGEGHGYCCLVDFPNLLEGWLNFDPSNTTKFDSTMGSIMTLLATKRFARKRNTDRVVIDKFFVKRDNSGIVSQLKS